MRIGETEVDSTSTVSMASFSQQQPSLDLDPELRDLIEGLDLCESSSVLGEVEEEALVAFGSEPSVLGEVGEALVAFGSFDQPCSFLPVAVRSLEK